MINTNWILGVLLPWCMVSIGFGQHEGEADQSNFDFTIESLESIIENIPNDERNQAILDIEASLAVWYPNVLIVMLDKNVPSNNVEEIVFQSHYRTFFAEAFRIKRLDNQGVLDLEYARRLAARRASIVTGAFPIRAEAQRDENIHVVSLLASYWKYDQDAVIQAIDFNMTRWTKEDAMAPVLFLALNGIEEYRRLLADYDPESYRVIEVLIKEILSTW